LLVIIFYYKDVNLLSAVFLFSLITYFSSTSALVKMLARALGYTNVDFITIMGEPILRLVVLIGMYYSRTSINLFIVLLLYLLVGFIAFTVNKHEFGKHFKLKLFDSKISKIYHLVYHSLKQSKFYFLYYLMFIGLARIDTIFIESNASKSDLAIFSTSFQLYQVAQLFFFSIITSQFIRIKSNQKKAAKIFLFLMLFTIVSTHILSAYIFKYLFKPEYLYGQNLINVLIYATIPSVINYYYIAKNNYANKAKNNFIILFAVFVIKLSAYYILDLSKTMNYSYGIILSELLLLLIFISHSYFKNLNYASIKSK
jgi:hypothetical protein